MHIILTSICLSLTLMIISAPAFSHAGHSNIFHSHSGIEYFLAIFVIAGIVYRYFKS